MIVGELFIHRKREAFDINYCLRCPRRPRRPRRPHRHRRHCRCHLWRHAFLSNLSFSLRRPLRSYRCRFSLSSSLSVAMAAHVMRILLLAASGQRDYRRNRRDRRHHRPRPRPPHFIFIFIFIFILSLSYGQIATT